MGLLTTPDIYYLTAAKFLIDETGGIPGLVRRRWDLIPPLTKPM
jgi:hypothetical protein